MKKHYDITISGRVQHVGFRYHTLEVAENYSIKGYVQNKTNGTVFVEAEGEESNLERFVDWCRQGPRWANVNDLIVNESEVRNYGDFFIKN